MYSLSPMTEEVTSKKSEFEDLLRVPAWDYHRRARKGPDCIVVQKLLSCPILQPRDCRTPGFLPFTSHRVGSNSCPLSQ